MTGDFLFRMLLGHAIGDYWLQRMWMALNKRNSFDAVLSHCFVYTFCIILALYPELSKLGVIKNIFITFLIFGSHWILDGTDLLEKFLNLMGARTYVNTEEYINNLNEYSETFEIRKYYARIYNGITHAVADNTGHIFLMYIIFRIFI